MYFADVKFVSVYLCVFVCVCVCVCVCVRVCDGIKSVKMFQDDLTSEDLNKSDLFVVNSAGDVPLLAAARKARYNR